VQNRDGTSQVNRCVGVVDGGKTETATANLGRARRNAGGTRESAENCGFLFFKTEKTAFPPRSPFPPAVLPKFAVVVPVLVVPLTSAPSPEMRN
jgi:hypothetical protein